MKEVKRINFKKTKIAVVVGEIGHLGGVILAAFKEVERLKKLGFDAELVVLHRIENSDYKKVISNIDVPIRFLSDDLNKILKFNFKIPFFTFFSFFHLSAIIWAPKLIKKYGYNVLLIHETYNCLSGVFSAKYSGAKLISYIWDPVSYIVPRVYSKKISIFLMPLVKYICFKIDKFIIDNSNLVLIGSGLHEKLIKSFGSKTKYQKVFPGTEILEKFPAKRKKVVVALTKWDRAKRPEFLLEVAKKINGNYRFIIGGNWTDQEQRIRFEKSIVEFGLENRISLLGRISEKEKYQLFSQSKVLIHPIVEAFGMFALEAAACGCPFIIPEKSGVTELFKEGRGGYFLKEGDAEGYANKVNLLLSNSRLANKMGCLAWKTARNYSWDAHIEKIVLIIKN